MARLPNFLVIIRSEKLSGKGQGRGCLGVRKKERFVLGKRTFRSQKSKHFVLRIIYGNDAKTGEKLWAVSDNGLRNRGASPAMHGALLYLISDKSFFILEAATGKVIVRKPLPYNVDVTSTPLLTDKEIIFGSAQKGLIALDSETLEEKWTCPVGDALVYTCPYSRQPSATIETSAVWAGDIVYVAASDGMVYGINKEDGKVVWKHATGAPMFGSVALSGNALVVSDFGGNVYLFCK